MNELDGDKSSVEGAGRAEALHRSDSGSGDELRATTAWVPLSRLSPASHKRGRDKIRLRNPLDNDDVAPAPKPEWIRVRLDDRSGQVRALKNQLRAAGLVTVCEEASCPNLPECFARGTATFMILGDICTRRCRFCDVAHGRPLPVDVTEPERLADVIADLRLKYVVITSVDRDDLPDGGAGHFSDCVKAIRARSPEIRVEILVPDFRGRLELALDRLACELPNVFNHNLETVPRLYRVVRPGANYAHSIGLLQSYKARFPVVHTKSGLMLGLGETTAEVLTVMDDLRAAGCEMLSLGQYLPPSRDHLRVARYVPLDEFEWLGQQAEAKGFIGVASAPLVRSSYHADRYGV